MRLVALILLLFTLPAMAEELPRPEAGLLWNDSGLPMTLPLQIVTEAGGPDRAILLSRDEGGAAEVAGYVHAGQFFRLLVPPGDWRIAIASGRDWQGRDALFGPKTEIIDLPEPLRFHAGEAELNGHVLHLTIGEGGALQVTVGPRIICRIPAGQAAPARAARDVSVPPIVQPPSPVPSYRRDPRDALAHDRLSDGRLDPRDPLAHDQLSDGRLDPRDPLAHDRLNRAPVGQPAAPHPPTAITPLRPRRGEVRLRSVLCD